MWTFLENEGKFSMMLFIFYFYYVYGVGIEGVTWACVESVSSALLRAESKILYYFSNTS